METVRNFSVLGGLEWRDTRAVEIDIVSLRRGIDLHRRGWRLPGEVR